MGPVVVLVLVVAKHQRLVTLKYSPWSATVDNLVHISLPSVLGLVSFSCVPSFEYRSTYHWNRIAGVPSP